MRWFIPMLQDKSNFLMLHDFMKCCSGTKLNLFHWMVNKCLNGSIVSAYPFVISGSGKMMFTKLLLGKKLDDAGNRR